MTSALGCCGHANTSNLRFTSSDVSGSDLVTLGLLSMEKIGLIHLQYIP